MRPLDPLRSIKLKLGVVILAAVAVSTAMSIIGFQLGWPLWVRPIVAGSIGLVMVQVLAHGMTSPLRQMVAVTKAMARGEYGLRVRETSRDEVGQLARAFNTMAAELAETERLRNELVANVSHELRTPISALQALLENLVDGVSEPDPQAIRTMLVQVERLGRLVTQLLDLSKLEAGSVPLERRIFRVADVLEQAAAESRLHAGDVTVEVLVEPDALSIDGDPERIHQVVSNLLENAVRYSPRAGKVELTAHPHNGSVAIEVADEGPGIDPDQAGRVFDRFYRANPARSSTDGGSGLGLAIARWVVELHGGRIDVRPNHPKGCRMVVALPSKEIR